MRDFDPAEAEADGNASSDGISPEAAAILASQAQPRKRKQRVWIVGLVIAGMLLAAGAWGTHFYRHWTEVGRLAPQGGLYFVKKVVIPVENFRQGDPKWHSDFLGSTHNTIGAEGCALTSAAMVLRYYGMDTDPQRLNTFLNDHEGYTPQGWIYWERAADYETGRVRHAYEDQASYALIDRNLLKGNPVIVKLLLPSGTSHFVVIAGKEGFDYLTCDPGAGASKGLYPLRDLRSDIYGLRFYERLQGATLPAP